MGMTERLDGWKNALSGQNMPSHDRRTLSDYEATLITPEIAREMWRGSDIAARIVETWPNEMLREGYEFRAQEDKKLQEEIQGLWEDLEMTPALWEGSSFERGLGGGAVFIGVRDGREPHEPVNLNTIQSVDFLTPLECTELQPFEYYSNPMAPKYGRPATYQLTPSMPAYEENRPADATLKIHESRLGIFPGLRVSRYQRSVNGWGDSVLARVYAVLRDFDTAWDSVGTLVSDFAPAVMKIKGLADMIGLNKDQAVQNRLAAINMSKSTVRMTLLDAEGEDIARLQTPLTGIPELLDRFGTRVAAAADIPQTLLMGQSPAGLNATGESDIRFFYDRIRAAQDRKLRPIIEKVTRYMLLALMGKEPDGWSIFFRPLWQPTELEQAQARFTQAQTDEKYVMMDALTPEDVTRNRFGGDEYNFNTTVDLKERSRASTPEADLPEGD